MLSQRDTRYAGEQEKKGDRMSRDATRPTLSSTLAIIFAVFLTSISLPATAQEEPLEATANLMAQIKELSDKLTDLSERLETTTPEDTALVGSPSTDGAPPDEGLPKNFILWYLTPALDLLATIAAIIGGYVGFRAWRRQLTNDRERSFNRNVTSLIRDHLSQQPSTQ